jgi:repressor LexA
MLTDRQEEVLAYLKEEQRRTGIMPSTRELQQHFGFASQTAAVSHLRALEKKGAIVRLPGKARAVAFPEELDREEIAAIPVYGSIAAGFAETVEQDPDGVVSVGVETFGIDPGAPTFALKVRGESMIGAYIVPGDYVILEVKEPRNGDVVAALIDGETTLKRYVRRRDGVFLQAENPDFPDLIPARELVIQGVMIGLLRCR